MGMVLGQAASRSPRALPSSTESRQKLGERHGSLHRSLLDQACAPSRLAYGVLRSIALRRIARGLVQVIVGKAVAELRCCGLSAKVAAAMLDRNADPGPAANE